MPIKVQSDLPARAILESENIFVMDENRADEPGYPSAADSDPESDADEGRDGDPASACTVQYTAAGGLYVSDAVDSRIQEHVSQPFK